MHFNWIDWIIFFVVLYHIIDGWDKGLVSILGSTIAFLISLWVAIRFNTEIGGFVGGIFGLPVVWRDAIGYILLALPTEMILNLFIEGQVKKAPPEVTNTPVNRIFGSIFAVGNALIFFAFLLLVILALPIRGTIRRDIKDSVIGHELVVLADRYGGSVRSSLDSIVEEARKFVTIKPQSQERVDLNVNPNPDQLTVDPASEEQMVALVNEERVNEGLPPLRVDDRLVTVARDHSLDMFNRRYFSHVTPEGQDLSFRARQQNVEYRIIGENLGYAPDVEMAHTGLMNSDAHRQNILDPTFTRIGIGIIDGDVYGKLFTQIFAN